MRDALMKKLAILAESAKYDASCASSGVGRSNARGGIGNAARLGVCHSFTADGRCISLLKVLYSNHCRYDCAYCVNRRSNDLPRTAFTVEELTELTLEFYRRNYIEGLFLSSGVLVSPDHTMERLVRVVKNLRVTHGFNGYIHLKSIPGAARELVYAAGLYADRLSVNIEIPSETNLRRLAPEKNYESVYAPMRYIHERLRENREERGKFRSAPVFAPAGQSTQVIVGASDERDRDILRLSSLLYKGPGLKRVFYSAFVPVNGHDSRLPALQSAPLRRENRLYQADWLMRLYHFEAAELLDEAAPDLDMDVDPKLAWALRHPEFFPVDLNTDDYLRLLRVPGIGLISARRIVLARRHGRLEAGQLGKLGVAVNRAAHFILPRQHKGSAPFLTIREAGPERVRRAILSGQSAMRGEYQLSLPIKG